MIEVLGLQKIEMCYQNNQTDIFCFLREQYIGKPRLSGEPGYYHPFRMMKELISCGVNDPKLVLGALLHDILEDTDIVYEQFQWIFGKQIFEIVYWLSNLDKNRVPMIKSDYFLKFRSSIHAEWRILFIKLFDCLDNLRTLGELSLERQMRFRKEKREVYLTIFKENVMIIPSEYRPIFVDKTRELSQILNVL